MKRRSLYTLSARALMAAFWITAGTGCLRCCSLGDDTAASTSTCDEEEERCESPPSGCKPTLPDRGRLKLTFSRPLPVEVRIYEGEHFETGRLAKVFKPSDTAATVELPWGRYAATALYVRGGDTVLAVDGDGLGYEALSTCEGTCYEVDNGEADLELRE